MVQEASKILEGITESTSDLTDTLTGLVERADLQQKASQLADLAKEVSKTTVETSRTAAEKVNVGARRGATPYVAGGILLVLLLWVVARRRKDDTA